MTTVLDRRGNPRAEPVIAADLADVTAVNRKAERDAYASRRKVYSKLASGRFRTRARNYWPVASSSWFRSLPAVSANSAILRCSSNLMRE